MAWLCSRVSAQADMSWTSPLVTLSETSFEDSQPTSANSSWYKAEVTLFCGHSKLVTESESSNQAVKPNFGDSWPFCFGHYPQPVTLGKNRDVDWPVNCKSCFTYCSTAMDFLKTSVSSESACESHILLYVTIICQQDPWGTRSPSGWTSTTWKGHSASYCWSMSWR